MGNEASAELPPGRAAAAAAGPRGPAAPPDLDLSSLSEAERAKILSVMARAQDLEEAAPTPPPQRERCPLCGNSDLELACRCVDCGRAACARCGSALPQPDGKRPWVCTECQSKFRQSQEARRQDGFRQTPAAMSQAPPPAAVAQQSPRAAAGVQQSATSQSAQRASGMQRAMQPAVMQSAPMQPAATQPAAMQPVVSQPAVQQFTTPQMTATPYGTTQHAEPQQVSSSPAQQRASVQSAAAQQQRSTTVQSTAGQQQQQRAVVQQHMDVQLAAAAQLAAVAPSGAPAEEPAQTEVDEQEAERRRIQREELERHRREQEEQRQAELSQAEQERRLERMQQEQQRRLQALASRPPPQPQPPAEEEESDEEELPAVAEANEPSAEQAEQEAAEDKLANSTGGIPRTVPLPGRADWSPVSDLSPILDVSPSLEAAEQELMAQFHEERRMPRATSGTISGMLADFNKALSLASPPRTPRRLPEPSPPVPAPRCLSAAAAPCSPSVTPEPAESPASSEPDAKVRRRLPQLPRDQEPVPARRAKDRARVLSAPERPNRPQPPPRACSVDGGLAASSGGVSGMSSISTIGTVGLANTVSTASSAAVGSFGSLGALGTLGSVGTIGSLGTVNTLGTAGAIGTVGGMGTMGTVNAMGNVGGTMGSVGSMATMGSVGTMGTVGTVGSRLPSYMNSLKQQLREELRSVTDERRRLLELRDRDMRSEGDLAALLGWSGRRRAADQSWTTTAEPRRSAGADPWRTRRRGDKSRKPRSWHPSPYGSEDEEDSCEQRKASIKAEIAKRRQQIEENARLHAELYKLARLRQAESGVSPDLGIVSGGTVTSGGGSGSVLEAIDQVLRQERRRWPAASAPIINDECSSMGMMHPPPGGLGGLGGLHCGTSAEDRSMALIASTFPDSPISSEEEDEEPPAMPLLPDMPRRRRLHHMMQQSQEPELDMVGGSAGGGSARRVLLTRDPRRGGLGVRVVGGKRMSNGQLGAYVARVGRPDTLGQLSEGDRVLEWNGVPLTGKTYEQVQRIMDTHNTGDEVELLVQSDWDSFDSPVPTQRRRQHGRRARFEWSPPNEWPQSTAEMLQASPPTASLRPYRCWVCHPRLGASTPSVSIDRGPWDIAEQLRPSPSCPDSTNNHRPDPSPDLKTRRTDRPTRPETKDPKDPKEPDMYTQPLPSHSSRPRAIGPMDSGDGWLNCSRGGALPKHHRVHRHRGGKRIILSYPFLNIYTITSPSTSTKRSGRSLGGPGKCCEDRQWREPSR